MTDIKFTEISLVKVTEELTKNFIPIFQVLLSYSIKSNLKKGKYPRF